MRPCTSTSRSREGPNYRSRARRGQSPVTNLLCEQSALGHRNTLYQNREAFSHVGNGKKSRPYFQCHPIVVYTEDPIIKELQKGTYSRMTD